MFTNAEYADIHYVYGFCDGNSNAAVEEYRIRFPNRRVPHSHTFVEVHRRFREHGFGVLNNQNRIGCRRDNRILQVFNNDRTMSTRRAARQLGVCQSKVFRALKQDHRKAFHLQPVQGLLPEDAERRLTFCRWILESVEINPHFLHKVLWTDESNFTRAGVVNYHNLHVWDHENPRCIRQSSFQHEFSANVWIGVISNNLCGPHFLPPRLNANLFHDFLENILPEVIEDVPLNLREECWMQLDGAPAHYGRQVQHWLDENYPRRWIGRQGGNRQNLIPGEGPVACPARSPDLNPLDYYVWGHVKGIVYATQINTRDELTERIQNACNELRNDPIKIGAAVNSLIRRCNKCIEAGGMHFEHLL